METWEALDVDDSDLSELLPQPTSVPSKRPLSQRQHSPSRNSSQDPRPPLQPCSQLRRPSQPNNENPGNLEPPSQWPPPQVRVENLVPQVTTKRRIPGPAGGVQAAMRRQTLNARSDTQHCVARVSQEENGANDEDFNNNAWLCALDFLGEDSASKLPLLRDIKKNRGTERVSRVVGIVKTCKPNGLGDLIVTLKDPSDVMGATIHRKVVSESKFSRDISTGSVVVLQEVVAFSTFYSVKHLNITLENVIQVFAKESGRPAKRSPSCTGRCADPDARPIAAESLAPLEDRPSGGANVEVAREADIEMREALPEATRQRSPKAAAGSSSPYGGFRAEDAVETHRKIETDNEIRKLVSGASHAQWTDEQLNELFADMEDF